MKKIFFFIILILPMATFAESPADNMGFGIDTLTCPNGSNYGICGGINSSLHNQFVSAMKKMDAKNAILILDKMNHSIDGSDNPNISNFLSNPLIGTFAPEGIPPLAHRILATKAYEGGIIMLTNDCIQECDYSLFYLSYIRYKKSNNTLYVYNTVLAPKNSSQYKSYAKLYRYINFSEFEKSLSKAFYKGKFNNASINLVYQNFVKNIIKLPKSTTQSGGNNILISITNGSNSPLLDYAYSEDKSIFYVDEQGNKKVILGADYATFKTLPNIFNIVSYGKDKNHVYFQSNLISWADAKTFSPVGKTLLKDKNHVYVYNHEIYDADPETIEELDMNYSKDKNHVYYFDSSRNLVIVIYGADVRSFRVDSNNYNSGYAKDNFAIFKNGVKSGNAQNDVDGVL